MTDTTTIPATLLIELVAAILRRHTVPARAARQTAQTLVGSDQRGIHSHGVARLFNYLERLQAGAINPRPTWRWHLRRRGVAILDADNALGPAAIHQAMPTLHKRATRYGIALVGVIRCEHVGALDSYVRQLSQQGYIGIMCCNTPVAMAPLSGRQAVLGSNPLAIAIPGVDGPLMLYDGATAATSRGRILAAATHNHTIPTGWAIDAQGESTNDPHAALAGALLPAGALGYGLGLAIALLTGALLAGRHDGQLNSFLQAPHHPAGSSSLLIAIDPDVLQTRAQLQHVGSDLVAAIRQSTGDPRIPGDRRTPQDDVSLASTTVRRLRHLAQQHRLPARLHIPVTPTK